MKPNLKIILLLGVAGLICLISSEFLEVMPLKILGIIILAAVFVINSQVLVRRIEKLENGK